MSRTKIYYLPDNVFFLRNNINVKICFKIYPLKVNLGFEILRENSQKLFILQNYLLLTYFL